MYNTLGEEIATLVAENFAAGRHEVAWNASGHASGVYLYRLEAGEFVETKKLTVLEIAQIFTFAEELKRGVFYRKVIGKIK